MACKDVVVLRQFVGAVYQQFLGLTGNNANVTFQQQATALFNFPLQLTSGVSEGGRTEKERVEQEALQRAYNDAQIILNNQINSACGPEDFQPYAVATALESFLLQAITVIADRTTGDRAIQVYANLYEQLLVEFVGNEEGQAIQDVFNRANAIVIGPLWSEPPVGELPLPDEEPPVIPPADEPPLDVPYTPDTMKALPYIALIGVGGYLVYQATRKQRG